MDRVENAKLALKGLSVGDAFGESFFCENPLLKIQNRLFDAENAYFTDDTIMGIGIVETLERFNEIEQDFLAYALAKNYFLDENRGYGATVRTILKAIHEGEHWTILAPKAFDGMGSMGNGAAMRVAPLGAFFYDDIEKLLIEAEKSAVVTHSHIEAIEGAKAVALAAAKASLLKQSNCNIEANDFLDFILKHLKESDTKAKINKSLHISNSYHIDTVVNILGNGLKMTAQDTVPIALWCAAHNLNNFENALWRAVEALGDRDTICGIVASIVIMKTGLEIVPQQWLNKIEKVEKWIFLNL